MVKALVVVARLFVTVPAFELAGALLILGGVYGLAGGWWTLIGGGVLAFLKSLDLTLSRP